MMGRLSYTNRGGSTSPKAATGSKAARPPRGPSAARVRTPPPPIAIPDLAPDGAIVTPGALPSLVLGGATPSHAPPCSPGLTPLPALTPGAHDGIPLEAKAEAVARLWPVMTPFMPYMLRNDILMPRGARRFVQTGPLGSETALGIPSAAPFRAVLAIVDISGFTALTEALSIEGNVGLELLAKCMNSYFAQLIELVVAYGGEVSKFAGDALLTVFAPTEEEQARGGADGGLALTTIRATACMKELVERFGK